jgi:ankyrin repeat protein
LEIIFETARTLQLRSIFLISVISGSTALMESSREGHLETTRFLVQSGANLEAMTKGCHTPWKSFLKPRVRCSSVQFF